MYTARQEQIMNKVGDVSNVFIKMSQNNNLVLRLLNLRLRGLKQGNEYSETIEELEENRVLLKRDMDSFVYSARLIEDSEYQRSYDHIFNGDLCNLLFGSNSVYQIELVRKECIGIANQIN